MTDHPPEDASSAPKKPRQRRPRAAGVTGEPVSAVSPRRQRRVSAAAPEPTAIAGETRSSSAMVHEDGAWIQADAVEVHQGAVGRIDATDVAITQGALGAARADRVSVEMGVLGAALGGEVSVSQGAAGTIIAQHARVEQAMVRTLIARDVVIHRPSAVVFLVAQRVSGDVRVLLDWRGALAFGAAFALLRGLVGRRMRRG